MCPAGRERLVLTRNASLRQAFQFPPWRCVGSPQGPLRWSNALRSRRPAWLALFFRHRPRTGRADRWRPFLRFRSIPERRAFGVALSACAEFSWKKLMAWRISSNGAMNIRECSTGQAGLARFPSISSHGLRLPENFNFWLNNGLGQWREPQPLVPSFCSTAHSDRGALFTADATPALE